MIISLCFFFLVNFLSTLRQFLQLKGFQTIQVLIVTHSAFVWTVLITEILYVSDMVSLFELAKVSKPVIVGVFSIYLTLVCLLSIKNLNSKKVKTLWRIPILGVLAGVYFDWKYITAICMGYSLVAIFVVFRDRKRLNYMVKNIIFVFVLACCTYFLSIQNLWSLNIFFILVVVAMDPIIRMANISNMFQIKEK